MIGQIATARIKIVSDIVQGKHHTTPKLEKELHDAYERRTWRNKMHVNDNGDVMLPATAFSNCIAESAKYLSLQIPGKGKATYTKHFEAGVGVLQHVVLPVKADDVEALELFVPSDGQRGGSKRVTKYFPCIKKGIEFDVEFWVLDPIITPDVFRRVLDNAGMMIGVGSFRPRNNGVHGRFVVLDVDWKENKL